MAQQFSRGKTDSLTDLRPFHPVEKAMGLAVDRMANFRITFFQSQLLLAIVDTLLVLAASLAARWLARVYPIADLDITEADMAIRSMSWYRILVLLSAWHLFGWLNDLYDISAYPTKRLIIVRILSVGLFSALGSMLVALPFRLPLPVAFPLYFLCIGLPLVIVWRLTCVALSRTSICSRRILILGKGNRAQAAANLLTTPRGLNYQVLGYVSEKPDASLTEHDGLPVWEMSTGLVNLTRRLRADEIVVALDGALERNLFEDLLTCRENGTRVLSFPDLYGKLSRKVPVEYVEPAWVLEAIQSASSRWQRICKRLLDLTVCLLALPWFLLLFPMIAVAIKLNSPGPVFYRQLRSGLRGKPFRILKFRTMYTDAEKDGKPRWATQDDPRITRVGYYLRKLRLDELPQVFNVLRGEMSLIGPRPERPEFVEELEKVIPYYRTRLLVKPGLTGWAQINYRYGNTVDDALTKLQYDIHYVRHWSLWLDIYILFHTVSVVLGAHGT